MIKIVSKLKSAKPYFNFFALLIALMLATEIETNANNKSTFYFDAIAFKSSKNESQSRIDLYSIVPYQSLEFEYKDKLYKSSFQVSIKIEDIKLEKTVISELVSRSVVAEDFNEAEGGEGDFDVFQKRYDLDPGRYKVTLTLIDKKQKDLAKKTKNVNLINYNDYKFGLSGIIYLSSVEEVDNKLKLTPHLSDNIYNLDNGFFAFFELYNNDTIRNIDLTYQILDNKDSVIHESENINYDLKGKVSRKFIFIKDVPAVNFSNYKLKIFAKTAIDDLDKTDSSEILAITQHTLKSLPFRDFELKEDIDELIHKLYYIADSDEIEMMKDLETLTEKEAQFYKFWESKDPTPSTKRNEAFNQYYSRINFADKNFKSLGGGWRSDMGRVYVVMGPPTDISKSNSSSMQKYERWNYQYKNRVFIFYDRNGFGEYELREPMFFNEKYKYDK